MIAFLICRDRVTGLLNESTLMLIIIFSETTESVYSQPNPNLSAETLSIKCKQLFKKFGKFYGHFLQFFSLFFLPELARFALASSRAAELDQFVTCMVIQFLQTSWRCATLHRTLTTLPWRVSLWQTPIRHGWQLPFTLNHSSVYRDHSPSCLDPAEWRIRAQSGSRGILGSMLNMGCERLFILSQPSGKVLPI